MQSFDDKKLDFLGRNHNKTQAIQAINDAFDIGFEDINCDIIYDTQLDTKELLDTDISIIKTLPINHISAYSLTIEEGTKFFNKSSVQVENEELVKYLFEELNSLGFSQYEISNFSKDKDARSKHNLGYWKYKEYLGVGSGAVGCINNTRYYNEKDVLKYIQNPLSYENTEKLSSDDITTEKILLGFRSVVGVDISILPINMQNRAKILIENDKLKLEENIVYSSDFMLADELALYITDI